MHTRTLRPLAMAASLAFLVAIALILLAAPPLAVRAHSDTLWDQSAVDEFGAAYYNSISGTLPFGMTVYAVSDVTVGPGGWFVASISQSYTALDGTWGLAIEQGRLVVFPKTGALPGAADNPTLAAIVPMTGTQVENRWVVTASGLNLALSPGQYWIGITPMAPSGPFGPELQMSTSVHVGDDSPWFDVEGALGAVGWAVPTAGADANILITGSVQDPTPAARMTWGRIKNLYR